MKRKIIEINEELCDGCGACVTGCAEGALAIIDGKARLVKEQYCDGFGDCIGHCPTGALTIVERVAEGFDIDATREFLRATQGEEAVARMDAANERHDAALEGSEPAPAAGGGCPGARMMASLGKGASTPPTPTAVSTSSSGTAFAGPDRVQASELDQWPIQLHLVQPGASFFRGKELVILSTCSPVACPDVQWRFLRGRSVVVACPKLDRSEPYVEKLAGIMADTSIPKAIVVRMEVPCCGGLSRTAAAAAALSGRTDLIVEEATITVDGRLAAVSQLV